MIKQNEEWKIFSRSIKRRLLSAIYEAVGRSAVLPKHMYLQDVSKNGKFPVGGGAYADVWKGTVNGNVVALKIPRAHCSGSDLKQVEAVGKSPILFAVS